MLARLYLLTGTSLSRWDSGHAIVVIQIVDQAIGSQDFLGQLSWVELPWLAILLCVCALSLVERVRPIAEAPGW